MSSYSFFIKNFPYRCNHLLNTYYHLAKTTDTELTLMISIASSGFIIPYERLHSKGYDKIPKNTKKQIESFLKRDFIDFFICDKETTSSWHIGEDIIYKGGDFVKNLQPVLNDLKLVSEQHKVDYILRILRNAMAHGSIFTSGAAYIDKIYFFDERKKAVIEVSPDDFHLFLQNWFQYLSELDFGEV
ncbi:MAG: hypothetical protein HEQ12_19135 [Aphanizomenon flos-aquae DEX188]|jgi:hypothetical protein|nr:MAG: hypothetical protein HEQ12_19135 [Aphanizomenon flos-aquae DEX188]